MKIFNHLLYFININFINIIFKKFYDLINQIIFIISINHNRNILIISYLKQICQTFKIFAHFL